MKKGTIKKKIQEHNFIGKIFGIFIVSLGVMSLLTFKDATFLILSAIIGIPLFLSEDSFF